jgi:hypothetical protein
MIDFHLPIPFFTGEQLKRGSKPRGERSEAGWMSVHPLLRRRCHCQEGATLWHQGILHWWLRREATPEREVVPPLLLLHYAAEQPSPQVTLPGKPHWMGGSCSVIEEAARKAGWVRHQVELRRSRSEGMKKRWREAREFVKAGTQAPSTCRAPM